jgi:predicted 3-demethylubiquinone-9 3-methyltransferase (glyoxalase superfamily)
MAMDSHIPNEFTFTPASSFFVNCDDEAEIDRLFAALSEGGSVLMPLDAYPFAARYAWVQDRFGVSWQLVFAGES